MAECIQFYLNNGLVRYKQQNIDCKKLVKNTSKELAEYFGKYIKLGKIYRTKDLLNDFNNIQSTMISQTKFTRAVRYYAEKYLGLYYYSELNRGLRCNIFVIATQKKKNLAYWKKTKQFEVMKNGKTTTQPDIDTAMFQTLLDGMN